jgi:uncharacterized repeat protein (TIGR01451 family)
LALVADGVMKRRLTFSTAKSCLLAAIAALALMSAAPASSAELALNSASVEAPPGVFDPDLSNNAAGDEDAIVPALIAVDDAVTGINGLTGGLGVVNVFSSDTLDGLPATGLNTVLSVAPGSAVPQVLSFDTSTGSVDVSSGTPAGVYGFAYRICEALNPSSCATAMLSVTVVAAPILADADLLSGGSAAPGATAVLDVLDGDMLNGVQVSLSQVVLTVVTPASPSGPGLPVPALDLLTGFISVPAGTPAGSYTLTYRICERLNPDNCASAQAEVAVGAGALSGLLYQDLNGNGVHDPSDQPLSGWVVEVLRDGSPVARVYSDADGTYDFEGLPRDSEYSIRFLHPSTGLVYALIDAVSVDAQSGSTGVDVPIDPSGIVYDSVSLAPVSGSRISLVDRAGDLLPGRCFVDPAQQLQFTGSDGFYRFDIIPGAATQCPLIRSEYHLKVDPPPGFGFVSTVFPPQPAVFNPVGLSPPVRVVRSSVPRADEDPVYYLSFMLGSGDPDVIHNHIPVDPFLSRAELVTLKTTPKRSVTTGDVVPYEITVRNNEGAARSDVTVVDILPPGMKYVAGSARVDGAPVEPQLETSGRRLSWSRQTIPAYSSVTYSLALVVGAGVATGERVNTAIAVRGSDGVEISNRATASVQIASNSIFDCSELVGKVFSDYNRDGYQNAGEPGLSDVTLATVNGQLITTDDYGRFHIPCVATPDIRIGSNFVLKIDPASLPSGWAVTNGNPKTIRLTRGKVSQLNFGAAPSEAGPLDRSISAVQRR